MDHVYVFESIARGDEKAASDVDVAFDLAADAVRFSLIAQSRIQRQPTEALGTKVDFIERSYIKPRVRAGFDACDLQVF
ncbi:MAG: nucleotidyltransferase domain-containing protein [Brevundimonas sp.]|uniref:nucleotidyltransferase family protein n=1 Tax=Brevundimonas sp. TaxID=1871086 RepID=UPI002AB96659|nr:nucleotidyltransferase domain-containing protein [Brevundimonas sp.]MDZ4110169.1 nucleotidyltransferase domain-containing protein [Brevundimonas sp.]